MTDRLGESFRQSRRELRFQLITWAVFAVWVVGYCAMTGFAAEKEDVEILLGMPRWVALGIALPWVVAIAVIGWFSGWYMQDTELVDDSSPEFRDMSDLVSGSPPSSSATPQDDD